jgi:hypothetical protein
MHLLWTGEPESWDNREQWGHFPINIGESAFRSTNQGAMGVLNCCDILSWGADRNG